MDSNNVIEYLENFIVDYGNAGIILSDRSGEYHYTDFSVADLNYALRTANQEKPMLKKKQAVVRTSPTSNGYWYEAKKMEYLTDKLNAGYVVVMCNQIGDDLEYILEKEVEE